MGSRRELDEIATVFFFFFFSQKKEETWFDPLPSELVGCEIEI